MSELPKPLPGRKPNPDTQVTVAFEMIAFVTGTREQLANLHARASKSIEVLYAACEKDGTQIVQARGQMRALRADEAMEVIPRKKHKRGEDGLQICSTEHVAEKHLTDEDDEVTCKLCLKKMKEG